MKISLLFPIVALVFSAYASAQETQAAEPVDPVAAEEQSELAIGDAAPEFELETFDGKQVLLSERFDEADDPVVLLFSRANW